MIDVCLINQLLNKISLYVSAANLPLGVVLQLRELGNFFFFKCILEKQKAAKSNKKQLKAKSGENKKQQKETISILSFKQKLSFKSLLC